LVHLLQSHIDETILWRERARNANPDLAYARCHLASALNDDIECATVQLVAARKLRGYLPR
jgi:hypothetical protein